MSIAVITGASSGLGREYALAVYRCHPEIDEFWLVARRRDRLEALKKELAGRKVRILPLDLTDSASFEEYRRLLDSEKPEVRLLINNSGFGKLGFVQDIPYEQQRQMVALNDGALTAMTAITLSYMQKGACILNVCSIASFVPTPRMAVYCSTKAYVLSFSKALREELKPGKINVLSACPGPMDTEFLDVADITGHSRLFDACPRVSPRKMAERSLARAFAGRAVYTDRMTYKLYRVLCKVLPHNWLMKFVTA